jgi:hypothetical protein
VRTAPRRAYRKKSAAGILVGGSRVRLPIEPKVVFIDGRQLADDRGPILIPARIRLRSYLFRFPNGYSGWPYR